jgi:tetratricopeptide (TPR) repeat protein
MRQWLLVLAAVAGVAAGGPALRAQPASPPAAAASDLAAERALLDKVLAAARAGDLQTVDAGTAELLAAPAFGGMNAQEQHATLLLAGAARLDLGDPQGALVHLRRLTTTFMPLKGDWRLRLTAAYRVGDVDDAMLCLETIARRWPVSLQDVGDAAVLRLAREAAGVPGGPERKFRLLEALYGANWKPADPLLSADRQWRELALLMLDRGEVNRAGAVAETVSGPYAMIEMRADRRFDPLIDRQAPRYGPEAAAARRLDLLEQEAARSPGRLQAYNAVAGVLIESRRTPEALKLLDAVLARAGASDAFADAGEELAWTMDYRARALAQLGRYDEALAQLQAAAERPEYGRPNVSQSIDLAGLLWSLGRAPEAEAVADRVLALELSPYGRMKAEAVRGCARALAGDQAGLAQSLAFLEAHQADAPRALQDALICTGDLAGAARLYVDRLSDPERRAAALAELQDYAQPPVMTPLERGFARRLLLVRARPEVRAAIAKVGRIEHYNLLQMPS